MFLVWAVKILSLMIIILSLFQGLLSVNFLSIWIFLELSTVGFLFFLFCSSKSMMFKEGLKLFLIQALSGLLILLLILQMEFFNFKLMTFFIALVVMFKMGAAPFHSWFLSIINQISWDSAYIFLTAMKFIPLMLLANLNLSSLEVFSYISFIVAALSSLYLSNLKSLILISSIFFLGLIYTLLKSQDLWINLLLTYALMFLGLMLYFMKSDEELSSKHINFSGSLLGLMSFLLLVNMAGVPPFPGFFLKLIWVLEVDSSLFLMMSFIFSSSLMTFMYLSFGLKNLSEMNSSFLSMLNMKMSSLSFLSGVMILSMTPLIWSIY